MFQRESDKTEAANWIWAGVLALWLATVLLLGGTSRPVSVVQSYLTASSLLLIFTALWRLRSGFPTGSSAFAVVLALFCLVLPLLQLVPIPYSVWKGLAGREVPVRAFEALGLTPSSLPLSLSPYETKRAAIAILPPLAALLGTMTVDRRHFGLLSTAILACALGGAILGMLQKGLGSASGLFFYIDPGTAKYATGTFANRNFFAAQLYSSVPFVAAFVMVLARRWNIRPVLSVLFTFLYTGVLVAVLAAVGSRAGIVLAMISVLLTFLFVFRPAPRAGLMLGTGKGLLVALVALAIMAQASMVGILRLAETDPLTDFRGTINAVNLQAAQAQFPAGSGLGTFVPVYQLYESTETIVDRYVNHAHNDWLELLIEGGATAVFLAAVSLAWFLYGLFRAYRLAAEDAAHAHIRAAAIVIPLLLLHAAVDFPFRNDALATLFGLCAGFLSLSGAKVAVRRGQAPAGRTGVGVQQQQARGFAPSPRGFSSKKPPIGGAK